MEDGYLGEIRIFAGNFAPRKWAFCAGQLLDISTNQALFSIIGTIYGGDGRTTFGLPDLRARVVVGAGDGRSKGLSVVPEGAIFGLETTSLYTANLPAHTHAATVTGIQATGKTEISIPASTETGNTTEPGANVILSLGEVQKNNDELNLYSTENSDTTLKPFSAPVNVLITDGNVNVGQTGQNMPFNNLQPSLGVNYIICIDGLYPSRN